MCSRCAFFLWPCGWVFCQEEEKHGSGDAHKTFEDKTRLDLSSTILYVYSYATEVWSAAVDARYHRAKTLHADCFKPRGKNYCLDWFTVTPLFLTTDKAELNRFHWSILSIITDHLGVSFFLALSSSLNNSLKNIHIDSKDWKVSFIDVVTQQPCGFHKDELIKHQQFKYGKSCRCSNDLDDYYYSHTTARIKHLQFS